MNNTLSIELINYFYNQEPVYIVDKYFKDIQGIYANYKF